MELLKSDKKGYPGKHIKIHIDDPTLDFAAAKQFAKQKAQDEEEQETIIIIVAGNILIILIALALYYFLRKKKAKPKKIKI